ncbi:MAG: zf-TFIIB domain-containing protein [Burkholderiales bacterium]|nr:zf-TFIIB domain-containing protein [Burkholderiales bacterium]
MTLRCPRDSQELARREAAGRVVFSCFECSGTWLPGDLVSSLPFSASYPAELFLKELKAGRYQRSLSACPEGCGWLVRSRTSMASVDTCNQCRGVWFSREELAAALSGTASNPTLPEAAKQAGEITVDLSIAGLLATILG